ncbi:MAG: hypothetical protein HZA31_04595 [Opitutae bacterium]|nr:hypothetical protein [Opitutae bacterium]
MRPLAKQCRSKAAAEGYVSLMNDTKWREICFAFAAFEQRPAWRTRDFLNGHISDWDSEWYHHIGPNYCSIEWLEIDARDCPKAKISEALRTIGVPHEDGEFMKILGYKK